MMNRVFGLLAGLFLIAATAIDSAAQSRAFNPFNPFRKPYLEENARLRSRIDSLNLIIDSLRLGALAKDSTLNAVLEGNDATQLPQPALDYTPEITDSLLTLWYENTKSQDFRPLSTYNIDSLRFNSEVPDEVMMKRLSDMNAYITLPFNETVKKYMVMYSERMPSQLARLLGLSKFYFPVFEEALNRYNLPLELKYMAIVESMLKPTATSRVGAKGMWQFMFNTARSYGLVIDSFVDERMDVVKSADAAARYLSDAYRVFGDWCLAISSYNCGSGNVLKAIRRAGTRDFWQVYEFLPRETRGYMPAFVGAMYAMTYHAEYGIEPADVGMPALVDTFEIRRNLHFKQINEVVGIPMEDLQNLNPKYYHEIIPGNDRTCILNLPYSWTGAFMAADQDSLYLHKSSEYLSEQVLKGARETNPQGRIAYKVKEGDYLGRIAGRYHVSVANLMKWNHLRSTNLRIGQVLYIYK